MSTSSGIVTKLLLKTIGNEFTAHLMLLLDSVSYADLTLIVTVFVFRTTNRMSMAQGLFKVGPGAVPQPIRAQHFEKYLGPHQHSS